MKLNSVQGDLFISSNESSLAHCVSHDFRMGAGIAKIFHNKFGQVDELIAQHAGIGDMAVLEDQNDGKPSRYIYYLVTKQRYFHKPTYDSLTQSLEKMCNHMIENNIQKLSIPKIGCGLDKLKWGRVKKILSIVFEDTNIEITVYKL
jgi:O-acetyl-ADP-ribose deacetylase (regulator of RNase III)